LKTYFNIFLVFFITVYSCAQELNCNVIINTERVQTQEVQIFSELQTIISDFLNNRRWTDHVYSNEEKINCNLIINVVEVSNSTNFKCNASVQLVRPIYGVDYESPIFSFFDRNFNFVYNTGQNMNFNENIYSNNLTSILGFYAYFLLTVDYDSYANLGGSTYLQKALDILNNASTSSSRFIDDWEAPSDKSPSRFGMITEYNNNQFVSFRKGLYLYHRLGMDLLTKNALESRKNIRKMYDDMSRISRFKPNSELLRSFMNTKANELINVYSKASRTERSGMYGILRQIDSGNLTKYKKLLSSK